MGDTIIYRRSKTRDYTVMNNAFLRDDRLSWKAKGLFAYILSLPEDWKIYQAELMTHAADGETSFKSGMKELKDFGYLVMHKKSVDGDFVYIYEVIETPSNKTQKKPEVDKKVTEKKKKVSLIEREPVNEIEEIEKAYLLNYKALYEKGLVTTEKPIVKWVQARANIKKNIAEYGKDLVLSAVIKSIDNDFVVKTGYCLTTILSANVFNGLINGNRGLRKGFKTGSGIDSFVGEVEF